MDCMHGKGDGHTTNFPVTMLHTGVSKLGVNLLFHTCEREIRCTQNHSDKADLWG